MLPFYICSTILCSLMQWYTSSWPVCWYIDLITWYLVRTVRYIHYIIHVVMKYVQICLQWYKSMLRIILWRPLSVTIHCHSPPPSRVYVLQYSACIQWCRGNHSVTTCCAVCRKYTMSESVHIGLLLTHVTWCNLCLVTLLMIYGWLKSTLYTYACSTNSIVLCLRTVDVMGYLRNRVQSLIPSDEVKSVVVTADWPGNSTVIHYLITALISSSEVWYLFDINTVTYKLQSHYWALTTLIPDDDLIVVHPCILMLLTAFTKLLTHLHFSVSTWKWLLQADTVCLGLYYFCGDCYDVWLLTGNVHLTQSALPHFLISDYSVPDCAINAIHYMHFHCALCVHYLFKPQMQCIVFLTICCSLLWLCILADWWPSLPVTCWWQMLYFSLILVWLEALDAYILLSILSSCWLFIVHSWLLLLIFLHAEK